MRTLLFTIFLTIGTPLFAFAAQKYTPLVNIPGVTDSAGGTSFEDYVNFLYAASIAIAALLAVIKMIIAGVKYMMTDIVTSKSDAIGDIKGALIGLLIILGAFIVLETINPYLTKGNIEFQKLPERPKIFTRPSVASIDRLSSEDSCAAETKSDTTRDRIFTINTSNCQPADDPARVISGFREKCTELKGTVTEVEGSGGKGFQCKAALFAETFKASEYGDGGLNGVNLDDAYVHYQGNLATYDAEGFCKKKYPTTSLSDCLNDVEDAFINDDDFWSAGAGNAYCENNAGKAEGRFGCKLPLRTLTYDEAEAMYRRENPGAGDDYDIDSDDYELMCGKWSNNTAEFIDTHKSGDAAGSDYMCVTY
ncbi:MAG: hypothetical protein RL538_171 [Candidatus Parcubacteria bacterium]|jgi:hypothetical protein